MVGKGRVNESESESRSMLLDAGRRTVHVCMSGMYALRYAQGRCSSVLLERFPITTSTVRVFANVMLYHVLTPPPGCLPPCSYVYERWIQEPGTLVINTSGSFQRRKSGSSNSGSFHRQSSKG
jgi:hypothetical protein